MVCVLLAEGTVARGAELVCAQGCGVLLNGAVCLAVCSGPIWALKGTGGWGCLVPICFPCGCLPATAVRGHCSAGRSFPKLGQIWLADYLSEFPPKQHSALKDRNG